MFNGIKNTGGLQKMEKRKIALSTVMAILFINLALISMPLAQAQQQATQTQEPITQAQQAPLFSVTLLAPTSNPVRRQHAALIANALQSVGIDARVVYVTFTDLIDRFWPENASDIGRTFEEGGFDIGFIGWGFTAPVPDIKSQYLGTPEAFPPTGNNYALYNSSEANALLEEIYTTLDSNVQLELFRELSLVLNRDRPYYQIYMPADIVARDPDIMIYGDPNGFSTMSTPFNDLQYMSGVTTYTFAEVGDWTSLAPWQTSDSNSFYSLFVFGVTQGGLQLIDTRSNSFFKNEADEITASEDGRTWTIKIKPGILFHDGVEATADDYLFTEMAIMTPEVASVGLSDKLDRFGKLVTFTWLNGTTTTVDNSGGTITEPTSTFKALDRYTYQFTINPPISPYAFLNLTETAISPLPKHYLEQYPFSQWNQLPYATGLLGEYTFTWDTEKYGGSGEYTAYGPFGTGPYVYKGFDPVKRLAVLEKFDDYWDRERLEGLGYYTVETYNVVTIVEKDAAIAAYRTGEVNALDVNYQLAADQDVLIDLGANVFTKPEVGWQEMGINMQHPILGTGVDTPLGQADPSKAAEAARHVRKAISYLIPRELIVQQLLSGAGEPGTTVLGAFGTAYEDSSITPDPYDLDLARAELALAGYETGVNPIQPILPSSDIAAYFIYGQGVPVEGTFKNPITNEPFVNFVVRIQESKDNEKWIDTQAAPLTDENGYYHAMVTLDWPTTYVRAVFTGFVVSTAISGAWPIEAGDYYDQLVASGAVQQILPPEEGPSQTFTMHNLKDILESTVSALATSNDVSALSSQVTALQNSLDSLTTYLYASIGLAIVAIAIAVVAIIRKMKP
jgi:ABC-type transport system substrate-binding protein